jgi:hypothetical protein
VNDADLFHRFVLATSVAAGAGTAGIGLLVFAPKGWVGRAMLAAAAVVVMSGMLALLAADFLPLVAGCGAAVAAVGVLVGSPAVRRAMGACVRPLGRPRVLGGAAVLAAFGVWGFEAWQFDTSTERQMDEGLAGLTYSSPVDTHLAATALSDRGNRIDLHSPTEPLSAGELAELEKTAPAITNYSGKVIRRGSPNDDSNCHGWVFTGGRFNLGGRFVDTILSDNGYKAVSAPAAGDLCVYRGSRGEVTHTGVVRGVLDDGMVLIESKWGRMGVYLHPAGETCYGGKYAYHRTSRGGHLLSGMESVSDATHATADHP